MLKVKNSIIIICVLAVLSGGCATIPASTANYQRSNLTFGMVKKNLIKGQTTQAEVLALFGAPNITTLNKSGEEVWTYDKIAVSSEDVSGGMSIGGGATGSVIGGAGVSGSSSSTSVRSITLMITFGDKDIVRDYAVMAQEF